MSLIHIDADALGTPSQLSRSLAQAVPAIAQASEAEMSEALGRAGLGVDNLLSQLAQVVFNGESEHLRLRATQYALDLHQRRNVAPVTVNIVTPEAVNIGNLLAR